MAVEEAIANYRLMVRKVHEIRMLHPDDLRVQVLAAEALENMVESLVTLNELWHYGDPKSEQKVGTDGAVHGNAGGGGNRDAESHE